MASNEHNVNERRGRCSYTPVMMAVLEDRLDMTLLLIHHQADLSLHDYNGETALMYAANDKIDFICLLIDNGAPVDVTDKYGYIALMYAVISDSSLCVRRLLAAQASLDGKDPDDRTVVEMAEDMAKAEIVELLQEGRTQKGGELTFGHFKWTTTAQQLILFYIDQGLRIIDLKESSLSM